MSRYTFAACRGSSASAIVAVAGFVLFGCASSGPGAAGSPTATAVPTLNAEATPSAVPIPRAGRSPIATPLSSPQPVLFTSERHGYSLLFPDQSWSMYETPGTWDGGSAVGGGGARPGVDMVTRNGSTSGPEAFFASQPVAPGTTVEEWLTGHHQAVTSDFPQCPPAPSRDGEIDGEEARFASYACGGQSSMEATALHAGRAYAILLIGTNSPTFNARVALDEWLSRFQFTDD